MIDEVKIRSVTSVSKEGVPKEAETVTLLITTAIPVKYLDCFTARKYSIVFFLFFYFFFYVRRGKLRGDLESWKGEVNRLIEVKKDFMTSSSIASVRRVMPLENPLNHHTKEPNSFNHFLKLVLRWKSSNASRHLTGHALVIFQLSPLLKYFQVDIDNTVNSFSVKKKKLTDCFLFSS